MSIFNIYRYQILPYNRQFQGSIHDGKSVNDVLADKNILFWDAVLRLNTERIQRSKTIIKEITKTEEIYAFKIGIERKLKRNNKDFKKEIIDHYPNCIVIIWNHPDRQIIAIEKNTLAFPSTNNLINLISRRVNKDLSIYQLNIHTNPIFDTNEFWNLVKTYDGRIEALEFNFQTPNMASISKTLTEDLKEFAKSSNSVENKLELKSDKHSSLLIEESNKQMAGLLDYCGAGGGTVKFKAQGLRHRITVGENMKEFEIDAIEIETAEHNEILKILDRILND